MSVQSNFLRLGGLTGAFALFGLGHANASIPEPYQLGLQAPATEIMEQMTSFHDLLLVIITAITIFVSLLLLYCIVKFNEKANPKPSKTTHHTGLEVAWTVIPILILIVIAIPSFKLLYAQYSFPKPDLTIKAVGNQWYWGYEYPDQGDLSFDSVMLQDDELKEGQPRLLAVDNEVVVPAGKVVHVLVTANDVIHNWVIPAFGSKVDAVPGRVTSTWFKVDKPGVYYGQCGELCGKLHAFMPIAVRVVDQPVFEQWVAKMKDGDEDGARDVIAQASEVASTKLAAATQ